MKLSALAASCVLYSRTEYSQGFSTWLFKKESVKFLLHITFNFQNKLYFQSKQLCHQHAQYSLKVCYNKPIRKCFK